MKLFNKYSEEDLRKMLEEEDFKRITLSFYRYAYISDVGKFRDELYRDLRSISVLGRIYVSAEGINGQISVPEHSLKALRSHFNGIIGFEDLRLNIAIEHTHDSFLKLKIKVREKIVADGLEEGDINLKQGGEHVDAAKFNEIADGEDTLIIDMRNDYESEVGHFKNAIRPAVTTFRESLPLIEDMLEEHRDKKILMYCTGGIRCEKASAFLKKKGFDEVYQLDGGIINYKKMVDEKHLENKFIGKNFVFDERLGERITEDVIAECHQCGKPCDTHINCANEACHLLFIQCESCGEEYDASCSKKCKEFNQLPEEKRKRLYGTVEFNGTSFSKARYSNLKDEELNLD